MKKQILAALAAVIIIGAAAPGFAQDRGVRDHNRDHNRDRAERHVQQDRHGNRRFGQKIIFTLNEQLGFDIQTAGHPHKNKRQHYQAPKRYRADYRNYRHWRKVQQRRARHDARHDARHPARQDARRDFRQDRHDRRWNGRHHRTNRHS